VREGGEAMYNMSFMTERENIFGCDQECSVNVELFNSTGMNDDRHRTVHWF